MALNPMEQLQVSVRCGDIDSGDCQEECCRPPLFALKARQRPAESAAAKRPPSRKGIPEHLLPENIPPHITRLIKVTSKDQRPESRPLAARKDNEAEVRQETDATASAVAEARAIIEGIAQLYVAPTGKNKPRVGSWTFNKDMALLGAWFAFLRGETEQLQQVHVFSPRRVSAPTCGMRPACRMHSPAAPPSA